MLYSECTLHTEKACAPSPLSFYVPIKRQHPEILYGDFLSHTIAENAQYYFQHNAIGVQKGTIHRCNAE